MLLSVSYLFRLSAFLFPPQVTPLLFPLVSFVSFSLRLPLSVADGVRGWDWSPTSVIYYYIPVFLSSTNKTTVASNIWSWCAGYCWLFYYLCISLCLSAQLYSSPHSASVHPLLPSLSLPLFTPLNLSFTLHISPHFSLPTTHTCINMHTHLHLNIQFAIIIVFCFFFSLLILLLPQFVFWGRSPSFSSNLPWHHSTFWASKLFLIPLCPLHLHLELHSLVSTSSSELVSPQLCPPFPSALSTKYPCGSRMRWRAHLFQLLLKSLIENGILVFSPLSRVTIMVMMVMMVAMVRTYPHTAVNHSPETKALLVLNGQSSCPSTGATGINPY